MDDDRANVVGVCFEGGDLLGRVVVIYAQLKVIATANDPVLARNEATSSDGYIGEFKGLDNGLYRASALNSSHVAMVETYLSLIRPDVHMA